MLRGLSAPLLPLAATLVLCAQSGTPVLQSPVPSGGAAVVSTPAALPAVDAAEAKPAASTPGTSAPSLASAPLSARDRKTAQRHFEQGAKALRANDYDGAARDFALAVKADPTEPRYYQALSLAQESHVSSLLHTAAAERTTRPLAADRLLAEARGVDATNPRILQHDLPHTPGTSALTQLRFVPAEGIVVQPNHTLHSFHERTDTRALIDQIGREYGIHTAIDSDVQSKPFRIDLDNVDFTTAMQVLDTLAGVFGTPLDDHTLFFAADTGANRKRYEHLLQETVPLPGYSTEQINELGTMLRNVFELQNQRSIQVAPQLGELLIRAPADTLQAMDAVLSDLIDSGSEVVVDVKLYSVDTSKARNLGVVLPTSFTLFSARSEIQNVLSTNASLIQQLLANGVLPANATSAEIAAYLVFAAGLGSSSLLQNTFFLFGGGLSSLTASNTSTSSYGITPIGLATSSFPSINFLLQKSDAVTLDDLQLRTANRATAVFKAGMRYPIQTSLYSDIASSATNNGALSALLAQYLGTSATSTLSSQAIIPQFEYTDLGLTVSATPRVMSEQQIALTLEIKISALTGNSLNGIPVLANRQFNSSLQLQDGQTVMMASQVQDNEAAVITGIPGLNAVPGLSNLTNRQTNTAHTNLVLLITPHIVRRAHAETKGPYIPLQPRPDDD